jgi:hypothetical protein
VNGEGEGREGALGRREFLQGLTAAGAITGAGGLAAACTSSPRSTSTLSGGRALRHGGNLSLGLTGQPLSNFDFQHFAFV